MSQRPEISLEQRRLDYAEAERERIREAAREWAKRTAVEQGFPEYLTDPVVLEQIAALVRPVSERKVA